MSSYNSKELEGMKKESILKELEESKSKESKELEGPKELGGSRLGESE